jgi:hypothetical protein
MLHSTDRILTTHTSSLPRPAALVDSVLRSLAQGAENCLETARELLSSQDRRAKI